MIKVDQFKTILDRAIDATGAAEIGRLIGKGELEKFARDLAALHRPAHVDWAARFGLSERLPVNPPPEGAATVATNAGGATCEACSTRVSAAVIAFCEERAEVFGGRILCMRCQRKARRGVL